MKTWEVYGKVVGSKFMGTVQAETKEDAIEAAGKLGTWHVSLCHQCSGECDDVEIEDIEVWEELP